MIYGDKCDWYFCYILSNIMSRVNDKYDFFS